MLGEFSFYTAAITSKLVSSDLLQWLPHKFIQSIFVCVLLFLFGYNQQQEILFQAQTWFVKVGYR